MFCSSSLCRPVSRRKGGELCVLKWSRESEGSGSCDGECLRDEGLYVLVVVSVGGAPTSARGRGTLGCVPNGSLIVSHRDRVKSSAPCRE